MSPQDFARGWPAARAGLTCVGEGRAGSKRSCRECRAGVPTGLSKLGAEAQGTGAAGASQCDRRKQFPHLPGHFSRTSALGEGYWERLGQGHDGKQTAPPRTVRRRRAPGPASLPWPGSTPQRAVPLGDDSIPLQPWLLQGEGGVTTEAPGAPVGLTCGLPPPPAL